jgi:ABC-type transport system substrate-binding protein
MPTRRPRDANPVGTGPYKLANWMRSSKIILEANPITAASSGTSSRPTPTTQIVKEMKGKKMPQVGRIEISIIEEDQARLLAFQNGELDLMNMEGRSRRTCSTAASSRPRSRDKASSCSRFVDPEISYHYWNMQDPVVGGLTKEKIALRRAMAMAYNVDEEIRVVRNGQAIEAQYPIPPGVVGTIRTTSRAQVRRRRRECAARQFGTRKAPTATARFPTASRSSFATRRGPTRSAASKTRCGRRRSTRSVSGWKCKRTSSPSS